MRAMSFAYLSLSLGTLQPLNRVSGGSGRVAAFRRFLRGYWPITEQLSRALTSPHYPPQACSAEGKNNLLHSLRVESVFGALLKMANRLDTF